MSQTHTNLSKYLAANLVENQVCSWLELTECGLYLPFV